MKTIKASLNAALFNSRIAGNKVIATYLVVAGHNVLDNRIDLWHLVIGLNFCISIVFSVRVCVIK